ncbi:MAG: imidazole glycerol phosphate synthase subunit HisH [Prevotella sp.]|nr:imidazole glycerol phosphate synthase subunit HisH [Candidatus Prevotella equi]
MKVSIVKYNAGNIFSVINAVKRLGIEPLWTDNPEELMASDRVIFPGQGEASNAMEYLRKRNLDKVIADLKQPVLGICIGQQLLCEHSEEGDTDCIGIFPTKVKRFQPNKHEEKVPCMGWNSLELIHNSDGVSPLFKGLGEKDYVYFVHSYYCELCENTIAQSDYILPYSAALQKDNFFATQFHPEKSGMVGHKIIENFVNL